MISSYRDIRKIVTNSISFQPRSPKNTKRTNNNWNDFANEAKTENEYCIYNPPDGTKNINITDFQSSYVHTQSNTEVSNTKNIYKSPETKKILHKKYQTAPVVFLEDGINLLTPKTSLYRSFNVWAPTNTNSEYWSSQFMFSLGSRPEAMDSQNATLIDGKLVQPAHVGWGWIGIKNSYRKGVPLSNINWQMPPNFPTEWYGSYIQIDFKTPSQVMKLSYVTMTNSRGCYYRQTFLHPTEIAIFASNDDKTWNHIHTFSNITYSDYSNVSILDIPTNFNIYYKTWVCLFTKLELDVDGYFRTVALADFSLYGST